MTPFAKTLLSVLIGTLIAMYITGPLVDRISSSVARRA
jgi:putative effector of murein hydrolase LrgA (UPF0299 family)